MCKYFHYVAIWIQPCRAQFPDVCAEFVRGAVTSMMATWECFVDNLLSECFDVVVNYTEPNVADTSSSSSDGSGQDAVELRRLRKRWPNCQPVLQQHRALKKNKPLANANGAQKEHPEGSHSTPLGRGRDWRDIQYIACNKTHNESWEATYTLIVWSHGITAIYDTYILACRAKVKLKITSVTTVNDVLRLYYGV